MNCRLINDIYSAMFYFYRFPQLPGYREQQIGNTGNRLKSRININAWQQSKTMQSLESDTMWFEDEWFTLPIKILSELLENARRVSETSLFRYILSLNSELGHGPCICCLLSSNFCLPFRYQKQRNKLFLCFYRWLFRITIGNAVEIEFWIDVCAWHSVLYLDTKHERL